ncbi:hypothetical protein CapIbe_022104 [Capra ibex]
MKDGDDIVSTCIQSPGIRCLVDACGKDQGSWSPTQNGHRKCMTSQLRPPELLEFWYYQLYSSLPASFVRLNAESGAAADNDYVTAETPWNAKSRGP